MSEGTGLAGLCSVQSVFNKEWIRIPSLQLMLSLQQVQSTLISAWIVEKYSHNVQAHPHGHHILLSGFRTDIRSNHNK